MAIELQIQKRWHIILQMPSVCIEYDSNSMHSQMESSWILNVQEGGASGVSEP